jgi:hypothetical protein
MASQKAQGAGTQQQPLGGWDYARVAAVLLLVAVCLLLLLFVARETGVALQLYYVLLVVLGLAAAPILFGVMRSVASYRGSALAGSLELGGPVVGAALVVIGGFVLAPPPELFSFTVRASDEQGQPIKEGNIAIHLSQATVVAPLTSQGEANFKELSKKFRGISTRIIADVKGYRLRDPRQEYRLDKDVIEVIFTQVEDLNLHVLQLVPGWRVLELLPDLVDQPPAYPLVLQVHFGGEMYEIRDLRRQPLLLGGGLEQLANASRNSAATDWATSLVTTRTPEERIALEALAHKRPRLVPTRPLQAGDEVKIDFVHGTTSESLGSYKVSNDAPIQTIFLVAQEPPASPRAHR